MKRYLLIVNPIAGWGRAKQSVPQITRILKSNNIDFNIMYSERPWHAAELAREAVAQGYSVVVGVGGDGTSNEILNGLMRAKEKYGKTCAMGLLCEGRGNDFAYGMNVPSDLEEGCRALIEDRRKKIDVGRVVGGDYPDGRYFGNGIGIGFDAVVGFEAAKMKWVRGFMAYFIGAMKTIFLYYNPPLVQMEYNSAAHMEYALQISIMNGRRMGGGFFMAPNAITDDGLFDLCIAKKMKRHKFFGTIAHFIKGTQASLQDIIITGRTGRIAISAIEGALPVHADGETICIGGNRIDAEILSSQLEIIYAP